MPNVNFPAFWLMDGTQRELSDLEFRVLMYGYMQSMSQLSDGHLPRNELALLHPDGLQLDAYERLVTVGLWQPCTCGCNGYTITNYLKTQSSAEKIQHGKDNSAKSSKTYREKQKRELEQAQVALAEAQNQLAERNGTSVTGHVTGQPLGKAIKGLGELSVREQINQHTGELSTGWETVPVASGYVEDGEAF